MQPAQTLADLDIEKLRREVAALKPGSNFVMSQHLGDVSDRLDDGGINIHIPLKFEGGDEWLLRIPSYGLRPAPVDMVFQVRTSEVLTYKALRAAGVAIPDVYGWGFGTISRSAGKDSVSVQADRRCVLLSCPVRKDGRFSGS
jgi:hypothetical protein